MKVFQPFIQPIQSPPPRHDHPKPTHNHPSQHMSPSPPQPSPRNKTLHAAQFSYNPPMACSRLHNTQPASDIPQPKLGPRRGVCAWLIMTCESATFTCQKGWQGARSRRVLDRPLSAPRGGSLREQRSAYVRLDNVSFLLLTSFSAQSCGRSRSSHSLSCPYRLDAPNRR